jgi:NAD(P)H-flavin reductase
VTELLVHELRTSTADAAVYSCGPPPMLERVREVCSEWSVPGQLALEEAMACGFGACFGCVVRTRTGYRRICVDGPVLPAADLDEAWLDR